VRLIQTRAGLARIVFAVVGIWGLLAGLMLIKTLVTTKQLHGRVDEITHSVSEIDTKLEAISLMVETNRISADLLAAARPLPAQMDEMRTITKGMAGKVESILGASSSIETQSEAIEASVVAARETAASINATAKSIKGTVNGINATLRSTRDAAGEISASTKGINASLAALLPVTKAIDIGIGDSNKGIAGAADYVAAIRADIGNILAILPDIQKHARSIDCSPLVGLVGVLSPPPSGC
jgi:uncharacterized protein YoxC